MGYLCRELRCSAEGDVTELSSPMHTCSGVNPLTSVLPPSKHCIVCTINDEQHTGKSIELQVEKSESSWDGVFKRGVLCTCLECKVKQ